MAVAVAALRALGLGEGHYVKRGLAIGSLCDFIGRCAMDMENIATELWTVAAPWLVRAAVSTVSTALTDEGRGENAKSL